MPSGTPPSRGSDAELFSTPRQLPDGGPPPPAPWSAPGPWDKGPVGVAVRLPANAGEPGCRGGLMHMGLVGMAICGLLLLLLLSLLPPGMAARRCCGWGACATGARRNACVAAQLVATCAARGAAGKGQGATNSCAANSCECGCPAPLPGEVPKRRSPPTHQPRKALCERERARSAHVVCALSRSLCRPCVSRSLCICILPWPYRGRTHACSHPEPHTLAKAAFRPALVRMQLNNGRAVP